MFCGCERCTENRRQRGVTYDAVSVDCRGEAFDTMQWAWRFAVLLGIVGIVIALAFEWR